MNANIYNFVKPSLLAQYLELSTKRIFFIYGEIIGITTTNQSQTDLGYCNLIVKPYSKYLGSIGQNKVFTLTLSQLQQISFRDNLRELYLFVIEHQTGTEDDFNALGSITALTNEANLLEKNGWSPVWITAPEPDYWNGTDTTIPTLLQTQFNIGSTPTLTNASGILASGIITSAIISSKQTIRFIITVGDIAAGIYYVGLSKKLNSKTQYKFPADSGYSNLEFIGVANGLQIYKFFTFDLNTVEILLEDTGSSTFTARFYNRNPIVELTI